MITAHTFSKDWARGMYVEGQGYPDPKWQAETKRFREMFALTTAPPQVSTTNFGFGVTFKTEADLEQMVADGAGDKPWVASLGDEISLNGPERDFPPAVNQSHLNAMFEEWLESKQIKASTAGCDPYEGCVYNKSILMVAEGKAAAFYFSNLFSFDFELMNGSPNLRNPAHVPYKNVTDTLKAFQKKTGKLLNGGTTANFPPSATVFDPRCNQTRDMSYIPKTNMWVQGFRQGVFTMPFTEDYIFQVAAGSQQMFDLVVDVERAARPLPSTRRYPFVWRKGY